MTSAGLICRDITRTTMQRVGGYWLVRSVWICATEWNNLLQVKIRSVGTSVRVWGSEQEIDENRIVIFMVRCASTRE